MATAAAIAVVGVYATNRASASARDAAEAQREASQAAIDEQRRQAGTIREDLDPFRQAGEAALGQQQALLGLSGVEAQQQALGAFQQSPGQKFLQDRAQKNLLRNTSSIGGLGGGNVKSALVQQGIGFGQSDLQNQLSRLASISGAGQTATTNLGQLGAQSSGNIGGYLGNIGQANASGILGAQQAQSQGLGQLAGIGAFGALGGFDNQNQTGAATSAQPLQTPATTLQTPTILST